MIGIPKIRRLVDDQVWQLPSAAGPPAGREWIEKISEESEVHRRGLTENNAGPVFALRARGYSRSVRR
jgi:hypothetical protein